MNTMYEKHKPIIWKVTAKNSKAYGYDYEDLLSEAHEIFCRCCNRYEKSRGMFSTYLWNQLDYRLVSFIKKERKLVQRTHVDTDLTMRIAEETGVRESHGSVYDLLSGGNMETVLNIIFHPTQAQLKRESRPFTKNGIRKELRRKGWKHTFINHAFNALERFTNENC